MVTRLTLNFFLLFQETVLIVEKNPSQFSISSEELRSRQQFLQEVKSIVKNVKDQLYDPNELITGVRKPIKFDVTVTRNPAAAAVASSNGLNGFPEKSNHNKSWVDAPVFLFVHYLFSWVLFDCIYGWSG